MKDYTVAAFYFPNFHVDARNEAIHGPGWTEWELIRSAPPRFPGHRQPKRPLWGFEDESDPAVMARKIDAAADHGLDVWLFDWYHYDDGPFLSGCLDRGFLRAPNRERMKFALMWANHDWYRIHGWDPRDGETPPLDFPGRVQPETFDAICDLVIERYFRQPNYWCIAGCPVFSIYEINTLALSYESAEQMRQALDRFRAKVKAAGFPDLHLNLIYWGEPNLPGGRTPRNWDAVIRALGMDSATSYTWVHHGVLDTFPESSYEAARGKYLAQWELAERELPVPYFPNVTMGWDNSPRAAHTVSWDAGCPHVGNPILQGNTPAAFRRSLEMVKAKLDAAADGVSVVTINAWNEWPESSILEPEAEFGYGYLEAIREVFGK